jgi:hypothetical protein
MRQDPLGISRRDFVGASLSALVAAALPLARSTPARAQDPRLDEATLQAFFDTIIPGRKAERTVLGNAIHPKAILGVDPEPGAVEADALAVANHPLIGFNALAPAFLADLELRAVTQGAHFLALDWTGREAAAKAGLAFGNPLRLLWEAAAAIPFAAFCGAGLAPEQTAEQAPGYRVMGLPGKAPRGYADASYGRRLSDELTSTGYLD